MAETIDVKQIITTAIEVINTRKKNRKREVKYLELPTGDLNNPIFVKIDCKDATSILINIQYLPSKLSNRLAKQIEDAFNYLGYISQEVTEGKETKKGPVLNVGKRTSNVNLFWTMMAHK